MKKGPSSAISSPSLVVVGIIGIIIASSSSLMRSKCHCLAILLHRRGITSTTARMRPRRRLVPSVVIRPHSSSPPPPHSPPSSEMSSKSSSLYGGGRIAIHKYDDDEQRRYRTTTTKRRPSAPFPPERHRPMMSLIPAPINELRAIMPTPGYGTLAPTGDQYVSYLGRTPRERYDSLFEGVSVAFVGAMFSYFISFVIGQFLSTCLGVLFVFWPILRPEFMAYQRNWELVGGRDLVDVWMDDDDTNGGRRDEDASGLYGAYYVARIEDVSVVDDVRANFDEEYDVSEFVDYKMSNDELEGMTGIPWKLRLRLVDEFGRSIGLLGFRRYRIFT